VYNISEKLLLQSIHAGHAAKSCGVRIGCLAMTKTLCNVLKITVRGSIVCPLFAAHRTAVRMLSSSLIAQVAVELVPYFVAKGLFAVV
jgi:hypothetical protein